MTRTWAYAGIAAGLTAIAMVAAFGQSDAPEFEVADIHSSAASTAQNQYMRGGFYRGGRYEVRNATMVDLIRTAYAVDADKVTGGPGWMETDRFDVIAKAPADAKPETLQLMLRSLLANRFKLVYHDDVKPLPAYVLTPGKKVLLKQADASGDSGCKLQPQPDPPAGTQAMAMISMNGVVLRLGAGSLIAYSCRNVTMPAFADALRQMVFVPGYLNGNRVVDQTELKGAWDFDIKYSFNMRIGPANPDAGADVVTIFNAVEKQLGLKLELTRVPTPVIQVDSVNEKPTDNLPGVTEKMPVSPTEFEVADIKPSAPIEEGQGFGRGGCFFCPGGRVNLSNETMSQLISLAWNLNGAAGNSRIIGLPKSADTVRWDIVAKASTMTSIYPPVNGQAPVEQVDFDSMRIMLQALLKDRFKLVLHEEQRPLPGYALIAVKPKLKKADPSNRPGCKEGPGPDGKDPRIANPTAGRLVTCLNMTLAQFAEQLPNQASGYFMGMNSFPGGVVDQTKIEGAYDITISFSGAGLVNGGGGRGGAPPPPPGAASAPEASDPNSAISLQEAIEKQLGLKLEPQKNPGMVLVVDHVEEKPTDN